MVTDTLSWQYVSRHALPTHSGLATVVQLINQRRLSFCVYYTYILQVDIHR